MATYTIEQLYLGEEYNIMGNAMKDFLVNGSPDPDERTGLELLIVRHTLLAAQKLQQNTDYVSDITSTNAVFFHV